jgi:hypothetical protein
MVFKCISEKLGYFTKLPCILHPKTSQVELTSLLDAVQETETKMMEMSALNHLMSTHVLQQAQQIQYLYDQVEICLSLF